MQPIKQRPPFDKKIKVLAKTIRVPPKFAKASFERGRHLTNSGQEDKKYSSPTGYAIDQSGELSKALVSKTVNVAHWTVNRIPSPRLRPIGRQVPIPPVQKYAAAKPRPVRPRPSAVQPVSVRIRQMQLRQVQKAQHTGRVILQQRAIRHTVGVTQRTASQTVGAGRTSTTKSIKLASRTSKLPRQTVKAGVKTTKAGKVVVKSGKVTIKTIQTSAKVAKASMQTAKTISIRAGKAAALAAKLVAKAAIVLARIAATAAKAIMALISTGGGVLLIIIIAAAVIAALLTSVFGIFFSNEAGDGMPMTEAIVEINTAFTNDLQARINELSSGGYDSVVVSYDGDYDGDSVMANNWQDVLGVYAVKTVSDEQTGTEVITLNPEKIGELKKVFNDMNEVEITTHEESDTTYDENGDPITTTLLYINIRIISLTYLEGAALYNFNKMKIEMLEELMSPEYYELFAMLLGVDIYEGLTPAGLTQITNSLPAGTKGALIAEAAIAAVGTPYSKMDCSQLSAHAHAAAGISLPRTSVEQAKYCYSNGYMVGANQLQPGDLVFWSKNSCSCGRWNEIHHVGVYLGDGKIVDASSSKGRVVLRNLWSGSSWTIWGYARAYA